MTSNMSVSGKQDLKKDERMMEGKRSDSPEPSCVSMKSDASMKSPLNFRDRDSSPDVRPEKRKSNVSRNQLESIFKKMEKNRNRQSNWTEEQGLLLAPNIKVCYEENLAQLSLAKARGAPGTQYPKQSMPLFHWWCGQATIVRKGDMCCSPRQKMRLQHTSGNPHSQGVDHLQSGCPRWPTLSFKSWDTLRSVSPGCQQALTRQ
ncbi:uncharacterized protein Hap1MRO34_017574 [Clarias gariepinus]